jgi:hypothetical protein
MAGAMCATIPRPFWLGCDLKEACQLRQLLDLRGHDSLFDRLIASRGHCRLTGRAAVEDALADHFALADQPRKLRRVCARKCLINKTASMTMPITIT